MNHRTTNQQEYLMFGMSETQGTEVPGLSEDTALSSPPNYSTNKRFATPSSLITTPFVKSRRVGLSTTIKPISAEQFILNDDKKTQYDQFVRKPHAFASKLYNLTAPPLSYKSKNWNYFHLVGYYKHSPKKFHKHSVDCEYACCNICGTTVVCKKLQKGGAMRHTGAGLKSHLESVHKIYKEYSDESKSNIITIPEYFEKQGAPKYLNKEEEQEHINDATVKWIAKECLPIDTTQSISFQNMMKSAYDGYKNISRKQVESEVASIAQRI